MVLRIDSMGLLPQGLGADRLSMVLGISLETQPLLRYQWVLEPQLKAEDLGMSELPRVLIARIVFRHLAVAAMVHEAEAIIPGVVILQEVVMVHEAHLPHNPILVEVVSPQI